MSLRERVLLVLGVLGAIALVVYPMAYRLSTEQARASATAIPAITVAASPAAPTPSPSVEPPVSPTPVDLFRPRSNWTADAKQHQGAIGEMFDYECSPDGTLGSIWGSDTYTDDSSVCTAGVHQGVITREDGGTVTIVIRPAQAAYVSSTQNGVATESWGPWEGSFEVVHP